MSIERKKQSRCSLYMTKEVADRLLELSKEHDRSQNNMMTTLINKEYKKMVKEREQ